MLAVSDSGHPAWSMPEAAATAGMMPVIITLVGNAYQ